MMVYDSVAGHRRRREAAQRLPPLCSGRRDPLTATERALGRSRDHPRTAHRPTVTRHQAEAARVAARLLLGLGVRPIFDVETLRAMWRLDPDLAVHLRGESK